MQRVEFTSPPLVETMYGMQFKPVPGLSAAQLGAFWQQVESDWPVVSDAPATPLVQERFGDDLIWQMAGMLNFTVAERPEIRLQLRNTEQDRMLQVQNGRVLFNWIRREGKEYPRHSVVQAEFFRAVDLFTRFMATKSLGEPQIDHWEVTYINQIPTGDIWASSADWHEVTSLAPPPVLPYRCLPETFSNSIHYVLADERGRLRVNVRRARTRKNPSTAAETDVIDFRLEARGPVSNSFSLRNGIELGHETIVQSFKLLTTPKARKVWGEK